MTVTNTGRSSSPRAKSLEASHGREVGFQQCATVSGRAERQEGLQDLVGAGIEERD